MLLDPCVDVPLCRPATSYHLALFMVGAPSQLKITSRLKRQFRLEQAPLRDQHVRISRESEESCERVLESDRALAAPIPGRQRRQLLSG